MLIGLTGMAGCGKDTVGHYLHTKHGFSCYRFAAPLKGALASMLGVSTGMLEMREYKENPIPGIEKSPREMMQSLGTEWGRNLVSPDFWVYLLEKRISNDKPSRAVITDVRYANEAAYIRRKGGRVIHIMRPDVKPLPGAHSSEGGIALETGDIVLENASTMVCLFSSVDTALANFFTEA